MKKGIIAKILCIIMLFVMTTACSSNTQTAQTSEKEVTQKETTQKESEGHYPITIITNNYKGEEIEMTFEKAPERAFIKCQDFVELFLELGLEDKVIAASGLDDPIKEEYKEAFEGLNYLTNKEQVSKESIVALQPDFIAGWGSAFSDKRLGDVKYWNDNGTNTYIAFNTRPKRERTIENECIDILNIGKIFDVEDKAQALVDEMHAEIDRVAKETKEEEPQSCVVMEVEGDSYRNYGEGTIAGDLVTTLGAKLAFSGETHVKSFGNENLIAANPDTIFLVIYVTESDDVYLTAEDAVEKIMNDPALQSLKAVKDKKVYSIKLGEVYASGTRTMDGIKTIAKGLYPQLYK